MLLEAAILGASRRLSLVYATLASPVGLGEIIAERSDGFQRHTAHTLQGPRVVLLGQECTHEADRRSPIC